MLLPGEWAAVMKFAEALARDSRIKFGKNVRIVGVPAILVGVACIVLAAGAVAALQKAVPILPDTLREGRAFWRTIGGDRRELNP